MAKGGLKNDDAQSGGGTGGLYGITVNNIAPGAIETPINRKLLNDPKLLEPLLGEHSVTSPGTARGCRSAGGIPGRRPMPTTSPGPPWWWTAACLWNYSEQ